VFGRRGRHRSQAAHARQTRAAGGPGKTTLAARLATELDAVAVFDPFDANPFLAQMLTAQGPDEPLALRVELTFFALRIAQLREVGRMLASGHTVVADWALLKQPIFAATTLCQADVARVATTVDLWADSLPRPDVLIGLAAAASVIRQRVRHRGRDMETGLTRHAPRPAVEVVRGRVRGPGPAADPGGRQHLQHVRRQPRPRAGRPGAPAPDPLGDAMAQPTLDVGRDATTAGPLCRRLLITGPGQVELIEHQLPVLGEHDVYARTVISGISHGTEIAWLRGSAAALHRTWDGQRRLYLDGPGRDFPVAPGYESIARVSEVGPGGTGVQIGDLIAADAPHATGHLPAEAAAVAGLLPAEAEPEQAVFHILARVALGGVHDARLQVGESVVVMGLGTVGLLAIQQARHAGANVVGVDRFPLRVQAAQALGVTRSSPPSASMSPRRSARSPARPAPTPRSRHPAPTSGCTRRSAACASAAGSPPSPPTTVTSSGCASGRSTTATASPSSPQ
jgi:hypothetical protein